MTALVTGLGLALSPLALVLALIWISDRVHAARARRVADQIQLTDAVHRRLGAVVAPTVRTPLLRPREVVVAVPRLRPDVVCQVVSVINDAVVTMGREMSGARIVLTAQETPRAA